MSEGGDTRCVVEIHRAGDGVLHLVVVEYWSAEHRREVFCFSLSRVEVLHLLARLADELARMR